MDLDLTRLMLPSLLISAFFIFYIGINFLLWVKKNVCLYVLPLMGFKLDPKKYGKWSIVTGATSGIGRDIAIQLAAKSSNVLIIGRNQVLLDELKNEIEKNYKVEVLIYIKDFNLSQDYDDLKKVVDGLDVGILVNNVGAAHNIIDEFMNQSDLSMESLLLVNDLSFLMMTKMVLQQMIKKKRGIIINIGSGSAYFPFHYFGIYPSTKAFMNYMTKTLQIEYPFSKFGIYFNCINPFYVSTKMSKVPPSFFAPTPLSYAKSAVDSFEYNGETNGCIQHSFLSTIMGILPNFIIGRILSDRLEKMRKNDQKRRETKKE